MKIGQMGCIRVVFCSGRGSRELDVVGEMMSHWTVLSQLMRQMKVCASGDRRGDLVHLSEQVH